MVREGGGLGEDMVRGRMVRGVRGGYGEGVW